MKVTKAKVIIIVLAVLVLGAGAFYLIFPGFAQNDKLRESKAEQIKAIRNSMVSLEMLDISEVEPDYPDAVREYFSFYGLDVGGGSRGSGAGGGSGRGGVKHYFGFFDSGDYRLAGHIYKRSDVADMVIIVHGFMNHCGQGRYILRHLLRRGFNVGMFDLPGHGLSTGSPGSISSFEEYANSVADFYKVVCNAFTATATSVARDKASRTGPGSAWSSFTGGGNDGGGIGGEEDGGEIGYRPGSCHLVGHSTGGAAIIELLLGKDDEGHCSIAEGVDKVVLVSPLVRSYLYRTSKLAYGITGGFVDRYRRILKNNTGNESYKEFNAERDYLQLGFVPCEWLDALFEWNKKVKKYKLSRREVLIIQGEDDTTVDHKYNVEFLMGKFLAAKVRYIEGGRHELFNETEEVRSEVFEIMTGYLR
jgi:alpha-beta hydrolase superfamily lysophospholipase